MRVWSKIEICACTKRILSQVVLHDVFAWATSYVSNEYFLTKFIERYISTMPIDLQKKFILNRCCEDMSCLLCCGIYACVCVFWCGWDIFSLLICSITSLQSCTQLAIVNVAAVQSISILLWQMNGIGKVIVDDKYISIIDALSDYLRWFMLATSSKMSTRNFEYWNNFWKCHSQYANTKCGSLILRLAQWQEKNGAHTHW